MTTHEAATLMTGVFIGAYLMYLIDKYERWRDSKGADSKSNPEK